MQLSESPHALSKLFIGGILLGATHVYQAHLRVFKHDYMYNTQHKHLLYT